MDWIFVVCVAVSFFSIFFSLAECGKLNEYILDYQPLAYDRHAIHTNHQRVKRSADPQLTIRLKAYGRDFHLKLSPAQNVFGDKHQVYTDGVGLHTVDTSFIYEGYVEGEEKSWVHVAIHNGSLEGQIEVPGNSYHIEPAAKYRHDHNHDPNQVHTIIYPTSHVNFDPYRERRLKEAATCGVDHMSVKEFMEKATRQMKENSATTPNVHARQSTWEDAFSGKTHNIYSEQSNSEKRSSSGAHSRVKRFLGSKNACPMHLRADPLLFDYFKNKKHDRILSDEEAVTEILGFFGSHVKAISNIYSRTVFQNQDGTDQNTGLTFVVHRSTVMKNCDSASTDNTYCSNTVDVSNYLDLCSMEDSDLYCLAFTFTYRDFSGGTLGLAWVAEVGSPNVGVCGRHVYFNRDTKKSYNTGIVTIINFGRTIANPISQLTFAHEAGHNFGSPHDKGDECAPYGTDRPDASKGNYIMFPSATSGDKPHNNEFSPCSRQSIARIIEEVLDNNNPRYMCFIESGQASCGNRITEEDEECDCGFVEACDAASCCVGRDPNIANSGCKLRDDIDCSPDSGRCCAENCTFVPVQTCAEASECKVASQCTGNDFRCPDAEPKANGSYCNSFSKVCISGECIGSVCSNINDTNGDWEECFLTSEDGDSDSLCFLSCRSPIAGTCISSRDSEQLSKAENQPFKDMLEEVAAIRSSDSGAADNIAIGLPASSACDNYRGYCDVFSVCQLVDAEGPFEQLTKMIFDPVTLNKVKDWMVEHWWAVLLMCLGLVVFMGLFVKVCGYNTPGQNPKTAKQQGQRRKRQAAPPRGQGQGYEMRGQQQRAPQQRVPQQLPYTIGGDPKRPHHNRI